MTASTCTSLSSSNNSGIRSSVPWENNQTGPHLGAGHPLHQNIDAALSAGYGPDQILVGL